MKLGLHLGYFQKHPTDRFIELAQTAEKLGFDSVYTAEAYGSDAVSPAAWSTRGIRKVPTCVPRSPECA